MKHRHLLALAALAGLAAPHSADRLITEDGRILEVKKARETADGYELVFEHGTIRCGRDGIKEVEVEGDMSDYVPKNDEIGRAHV